MAGGPTAAAARSALEHLNEAPARAAVEALVPFFEGAPQFLSRLAAARPFRDQAELFERAEQIAQAMPEIDQIELINAHPRIGAPAASMSSASFVEQGYAGGSGRNADAVGDVVGDADAEQAAVRVQADLDRLNAAYEACFGFRFVVFVAGRPRSEIVSVIEGRLRGERDAEMRTAFAEVVAIARDRWGRVSES